MTQSNKSIEISNKNKPVKYDSYSRTEHFQITLSIMTTVVGLGIWLVASFAQTKALKFSARGTLYFAAILETIAAVSSIVSLLLICSALYILRKRLNPKKSSEVESDETKDSSTPPEKLRSANKLDKYQMYFLCAGTIVLTAMQIAITIDLWTNNVIGTLHKNTGCIFDVQTIIDTIALSLLLVGILLGKYNAYQKFKENHKETPSTIGEKIGVASSLGIPLFGFGLILLGKIFLGLEGSNSLKIPLETGGHFPLALLLRMTGSIILLCYSLYEINTGLNEATVSSGITTASVAVNA